MNDIIPAQPDDLDLLSQTLMQAGQAANQAARPQIFSEYILRKAPHTLRRQSADLKLFGAYLTAIATSSNNNNLAQVAEAFNQFGDAIVSGDGLQPIVWRGVTHGLIRGFVQWQLKAGYAITSVNIRLSTLKTYAKLAFEAGIIDITEHALIRNVMGYSRKEAKRVDKKRVEAEYDVRVGYKKAQAVTIPVAIAKQMKRAIDNTPQARRDAILMSLLLDLGLRCGEVALLKVCDVDLASGELRFYRPKVDKVQTHILHRDTLANMQAWFAHDIHPHELDASLLRGSRKSGNLTESGMTERAITRRVCIIGEAFGIEGLSAHDCRHYWATQAHRAGTDAFALQEAGGWNSLAMPRHYVEVAKIANANVKLE